MLFSNSHGLKSARLRFSDFRISLSRTLKSDNLGRMKINKETFSLEGEYIELCTLLKLTGPTVSGGMAKHLIADGFVSVDGEIETRKKCKIRSGQTIRFEDFEIAVIATLK